MEITLKLALEEVNALLSLLGETPSKLGFYPILVSIKKQADEQYALAAVTPSQVSFAEERIAE